MLRDTAQSDIDLLNAFLRGERSAVETYEQCISKIPDPDLADRLEELRDSHEKRIVLLEARIRELGGVPSEDSGLWGEFARLIEGSAALFGTRAALKALEEGEEHGRNFYLHDLDELSRESRAFVQSQLLAEQLHTKDMLGMLKEEIVMQREHVE